MMIDLHLHTSMSDGSDSPLQLLEKITAAGCKVFSVTDHDEIGANGVILSAMKEKQCAVKFITGCEIASVFEGRNLHLLCYGFNLQAGSIIKMTEEGAQLRRLKIISLLEHLRTKHGIIIPGEDKAEILARKIPGKVHITDAAMKLGIKMERQEFFDNYLDDMESREFKLPADKVIEMVSDAGGVVSFAHPIEMQREYNLDIDELAKITKKLKDAGLTAIEVYHSRHGKREVTEYSKIAESYGLLISGGSDYHGKNKNVKIGQLNNYGYAPADNKITLLSRF